MDVSLVASDEQHPPAVHIGYHGGVVVVASSRSSVLPVDRLRRRRMLPQWHQLGCALPSGGIRLDTVGGDPAVGDAEVDRAGVVDGGGRPGEERAALPCDVPVLLVRILLLEDQRVVQLAGVAVEQIDVPVGGRDHQHVSDDEGGCDLVPLPEAEHVAPYLLAGVAVDAVDPWHLVRARAEEVAPGGVVQEASRRDNGGVHVPCGVGPVPLDGDGGGLGPVGSGYACGGGIAADGGPGLRLVGSLRGDDGPVGIECDRERPDHGIGEAFGMDPGGAVPQVQPPGALLGAYAADGHPSDGDETSVGELECYAGGLQSGACRIQTGSVADGEPDGLPVAVVQKHPVALVRIRLRDRDEEHRQEEQRYRDRAPHADASL